MCSSVIFLGIRGPNPPVLCYLQSPGEGCEQHWGRWVLSSNEISVLFRGQGFIEYINCYISCKDLHRNFYLSPSKHVWNSLFWKQLGESSSVQRGWSWQTFVQVIIGELWIKNLGNWEPHKNLHDKCVNGDGCFPPQPGLWWECCGMGVTWLSWPQQAAWFPFAAALIQITQQSPCFAMIKRYSPHGKMCYSKLCVAPVANLIYTIGNRKAFFIWLNSRLWHEISFLKSTCWKCYDNKNAFFFLLLWKQKNWLTLPRFMYYCQSVLWHSLSLIIRCDTLVVLKHKTFQCSINCQYLCYMRVSSWWPQLLFLFSCYIGVRWIDNKMNYVSTLIIKLQTSTQIEMVSAWTHLSPFSLKQMWILGNNF